MNQFEYSALSNEELPHEAKLLYVMEFRRYMDYETGVVGLRRRLSYSGMRTTLEVVRPRRSRKPNQYYKDREVRYFIELLEKEGLIVRLDKPCVFRLPLATYGKICPDEQRHYSGTTAAQASNEKEGEKSLKNNELRGGDGFCGEGLKQAAKHEQRHISDIYIYNNNNTFGMSADFCVSDEFWKICNQGGVTSAEVQAAWPLFVAHYVSTPDRLETQARWESLLVQWVRRSRNVGRKKARVNAVSEALMDIRDTNW